MRGALIPQIFQKTLGLSYSIAKESAAATLMSTDIEGIATGIPYIHKLWAATVELAIGFYLLSTAIDEATFLVVLPILSKKQILRFINSAKHLSFVYRYFFSWQIIL